MKSRRWILFSMASFAMIFGGSLLAEQQKLSPEEISKMKEKSKLQRAAIRENDLIEEFGMKGELTPEILVVLSKVPSDAVMTGPILTQRELVVRQHHKKLQTMVREAILQTAKATPEEVNLELGKPFRLTAPLHSDAEASKLLKQSMKIRAKEHPGAVSLTRKVLFPARVTYRMGENKDKVVGFAVTVEYEARLTDLENEALRESAKVTVDTLVGTAKEWNHDDIQKLEPLDTSKLEKTN